MKALWNSIKLAWYEVSNFLSNATTVLVIALAFTGIIITLYFSIRKLKKRNVDLAIIVSTIVSCILMVPIITSFNALVKLQVEGTIIDEGKAEIKAQRLEVERIKAENKVRLLEREKLENEVVIAKQSIEIENLNTSKMLLERARLSMQSFQQIAELALTQANLKYTLVRKEPTSPVEQGWNIKAEYYHDEVLVVTTYDLNAKFGIDLKEVKVLKLANNSVVVSGIRPKFIGTDKWERDNIVKEIRRVDYKYGDWYRTRILDERHHAILANNKENQFDIQFNKNVRDGLELAFMDDVIVQLAQNFIKIVLAPLYENIEFDSIERTGALPLMDFLAHELKENDEDKYNLLKINEQLILKIDQFDTEAAKLEEEYELLNDE